MPRQGRHGPLGALGTVAALLLVLFLVAQGEKQLSEEGAGAGTRGKELEDRSRGIVPAQEEKGRWGKEKEGRAGRGRQQAGEAGLAQPGTQPPSRGILPLAGRGTGQASGMR